MLIHRAALVAALTAFVSLSITAAQADEATLSTGSCVIKKTEIASSVFDNEQTTSSTFVNVGEGGAITFTQRKAGCVAGTFFANAGNTTSGDNVHMQILMDGSACSPLNSGDYVFANADVDMSSHSVAFFCGATVPAGSHTVQVQWSVGIGGQAEMFQHTLQVTHS
jgi:hypothetical protein